jgi:hypothetical protein
LFVEVLKKQVLPELDTHVALLLATEQLVLSAHPAPVETQFPYSAQA